MRIPRSILLVLVAVVGVIIAPPARATTLTVTNTLDAASPPAGSLRAAIVAANSAGAGIHPINFAIPGDGPHVITLATALPLVNEAILLDGYTQGNSTVQASDDAVENTALTGTNAVIKVAVNGTNIGSNPVFLIGGPSGTTIRGLAINGSAGSHGIRLQSANGNFKVEGCFVGTDASGNANVPNGDVGISIGNGSGNEGTVIGGDDLANRNIIAGNQAHGIGIATNNITVTNNLIGINKAGSVLENGGDGVAIFSGTGHRVMDNSILAFGDASNLAIDLGNDGVTPNDGKDPDTGANSLQNFPKLTSALQDAEGFTTIKGQLKSTPRKVFTIQFFANTTNFDNDAITLLGDLNVKTNRDGIAKFKFIPSDTVAPGQPVTATATRLFTDETSEVSAPITVVAA